MKGLIDITASKTMSPSLEDYLETILFLQQRNGTVRVTDVALELSISKPSVNKAINNLKSQELVLHEHYGLLSLTEQGLAIATNVASRHIVVKRFLHELLGVAEADAEAEACKLEHSITTDTLLRLAAYLNKTIGEKDVL